MWEEYLPRLRAPRPRRLPRARLRRRRLCVLCVRACVMSSYMMYCRAQAAECARRAKLASTPELATERRNLGLRWLRLAEKAKTAAFGRTREPATPAVQAERR